ncbi:MAG: hypothetical protein QME51_05945, partial [Planctomycetota bacterium]|nr:hypothetical protein [Planctomycetota bacterium]
DVVDQVWWWSETGQRTVYFGTTTGYLFRLVNTGSALSLSSGWPVKVCDEVTSSVITDGVNLYFGGKVGSNNRIYGVQLSNGAVIMILGVPSAIRSIPSVDSNTEGLTYLYLGSDEPNPRIYRVNATAKVIDLQNTSPVSSVRAGTIYWPPLQALYVGDYSGKMCGVNAWSADFGNIGTFPFNSGSFSITALAAVGCYADGTTRLIYGDMGGVLHNLMIYGAGIPYYYDPPSGPPFPLLLDEGNGTPLTAPLPDNNDLIYVGNYNGKVFVVRESTRSLIKTYNFGSGVKMGDISYDPENNVYMIGTETGKVYYLGP